MALSLPTFKELSTNYPTDSHELLMSSIGGGVSGSWILNGCVVRMSKAFNYLGEPEKKTDGIPLPGWKSKGLMDFANDPFKNAERIKIHSIPKTYSFIPKFFTTYGLDKKRYAYRVEEFFNYLSHKYKKPELSVIRQAKETFIPTNKINDFRKSIDGVSGIICFRTKFGEDAPGTAASGHFTLWDGKTCLYHDYFLDPRTSGIYLWKC